MKRWMVVLLIGLGWAGKARAQEFVGQESFGSNEPLYKYDDQEKWKHGWFQRMPYYGGHHTFRPYNYHHVFSQSSTAQNWGMSMPYSQQFWHRYENAANLSSSANANYGLQPIPQQYGQPQPQYYPPAQGYPEQFSPQQGHPVQQRIPQAAPVMEPSGAMYVPGNAPIYLPDNAIQTGYNQAPGAQQQAVLNYVTGPELPR